jgi:hypothetical protein
MCRPRHEPPLYAVSCDAQSAGNGLEYASVAASEAPRLELVMT